MVVNLSEHNSVANQFLSELRDKNIQQDRARFRRNMERLGEIMAYEVSRALTYKMSSIQTPLGTSQLSLMLDKPTLVTVLRAGLPYFQGLLNYFDQSDCGFIGAYRDEKGEEKITINLEYLSTPGLKDKTLILIDPMLATGQSFMRSVQWLLKKGDPSHIHIVSLVAAPEGIKYIQENMHTPYTIWTFAIDGKLNHQFYIVPGLGDAGDLSYGNKI
jgi:uracil phosphoribosyltransferase